MSNPIQGPINGLASISAVTQPASGAGAASSADGSDFLSTLDTMMSQASGTPTDYETQVTAIAPGQRSGPALRHDCRRESGSIVPADDASAQQNHCGLPDNLTDPVLIA